MVYRGAITSQYSRVPLFQSRIAQLRRHRLTALTGSYSFKSNYTNTLISITVTRSKGFNSTVAQNLTIVTMDRASSVRSPCVQRGAGLRMCVWACSIELIHRRAKGSAVYYILTQA